MYGISSFDLNTTPSSSTIEGIIFSDSEEDKIPAFFEFAGKNYSYQVLPFYNEDDEINSYLEKPNWTNDTVEQLKRLTDRPIKIRHKPRGRGTSGPSEAKVPLSEDLKNAWACVTSCSISAIEAVCCGKPVFCDKKSFASHVGNENLQDIENPVFVSPEDWLYSLSYQQFTPEELGNGRAMEILMDMQIL